MGAVLLLFEEVLKHQKQKRVRIPDYLQQELQREMREQTQIVWQNEQ